MLSLQTCQRFKGPTLDNDDSSESELEEEIHILSDYVSIILSIIGRHKHNVGIMEKITNITS